MTRFWGWYGMALAVLFPFSVLAGYLVTAR